MKLFSISKPYSMSSRKATGFMLGVTFATFLLSVFLIRSEDVGLLALTGVLWPLIVPFGWLGPAVVLILASARWLRSTARPGWFLYVAGVLVSVAWFSLAAGILFSWPSGYQELLTVMAMPFHPLSLLLILLLVVVTLAIDRWIHTPNKVDAQGN